MVVQPKEQLCHLCGNVGETRMPNSVRKGSAGLRFCGELGPCTAKPRPLSALWKFQQRFQSSWWFGRALGMAWRVVTVVRVFTNVKNPVAE